MEIRKFRSEYNLELIPASHEGIFPGDLVWDPIIGPPDFSRKGMPNTIYTDSEKKPRRQPLWMPILQRVM